MRRKRFGHRPVLSEARSDGVPHLSRGRLLRRCLSGLQPLRGVARRALGGANPSIVDQRVGLFDAPRRLLEVDERFFLSGSDRDAGVLHKQLHRVERAIRQGRRGRGECSVGEQEHRRCRGRESARHENELLMPRRQWNHVRTLARGWRGQSPGQPGAAQPLGRRDSMQTLQAPR